MNNPLLNDNKFPPFSIIKCEQIVPAITEIINDNNSKLKDIVSSDTDIPFKELINELEKLENRINKAWCPISHMNSVVDTEELREEYNKCLPLLSEYATTIGQNEELFQIFNSFLDKSKLNNIEKKIVKDKLLEFKLSGIALENDKKEEFKKLQQEISQLSAKFQQNLLDATNSWEKHFTDIEALKGLPESALEMAKQLAERKGIEGWIVNLEFPSYVSVITYADDRALRKEIYKAYSTRASIEGENPEKWDNAPIIEEILSKKHKAAKMLEFSSIAEKSLSSKMAESPEEVINFLEELAEKSIPFAKKEFEELQEYAKNNSNIENIEIWDMAYFAEKLKKEKYDISQEELRPYFPETKVVPGLFETAKKLFGITVEEVNEFDSWHEDVTFYEIKDEDNNLRGYLYMDLYARASKRGGAWMNDYCGRQYIDSELQHPIAFITCNFTPPVNNNPSLLTHNEVTTLFHEFGHALQHLLTKIDYLNVSGINGVPWDAVELPSQFLENWCWEKETIDMISGHFKTNKPLPDELYQRMLNAKNFHAAIQMVRQLEFALYDIRLHQEYSPKIANQAYSILDEVREKVSVLIPPAFNKFPNSFGHIFAGGYSAGYYSYKWAELLSADAFSKFEENGIFDEATGRLFLQTVLEKGGSEEAMDIFIEFRGRKPKIDALLRHNGLS